MIKKEYMLRAIELAKKGTGYVSPNPLVGAVIVKDGRIIGEGWHERYGDLHAERNALKNCKEDCRGADMYVTLEPCCHHGKQPPCTEAIVEAQIERVIVGSNDPNPLVAGKGIAYLREHGIEVITEFEKEACDAVNEIFFHFITTQTPYVTAKYAMTLDGKIATRTGASKWITGDAAREQVHRERHKYSGIMVGIQTVLADDPMLNCRMENGKNPVRIICDSKLRLPIDSQIVRTADTIPTIVATLCKDEQRTEEYKTYGCQILQTDEEDGHISLTDLMRRLGKMGIDSILLEGGATLNEAAFRSSIVQKVQAYIAPKIFGGADAKSPVGGIGVDTPDQAYRLKAMKIRQFGEDIQIEGEVEYVHRTH